MTTLSQNRTADFVTNSNYWDNIFQIFGGGVVFHFSTLETSNKFVSRPTNLFFAFDGKPRFSRQLDIFVSHSKGNYRFAPYGSALALNIRHRTRLYLRKRNSIGKENNNMIRSNSNYRTLPGQYLFAEVSRRVAAHLQKHPKSDLIRLGIGDVTLPLPPAVLDALRAAVEEQGTAEGFRGYGPEQGYAFLRETICESCYSGLGVDPDEIFVSDGAKSDIGNFQELFSQDCRVAVTDPVYPVYVDSNVMAGRAGACKSDGSFENILYLPCTDANRFVPELPSTRPDLIYLCYPNNPTGVALTRGKLAEWVAYARENGCILLFDAAYEAYISHPDVPHSIYEIPGAREVAVEFRSYSKTAGFTGLRCGFAVVPKEISVFENTGEKTSLHSLWFRRQTTKFNGCPYIVQRAAAATHTPEGQRQIKANIAVYMENARLIRSALECSGYTVTGGENSPYVWVTLPAGMDSWSFFEQLLIKAGVVGTPGAGFGPCGEGHFRFTGFGNSKRTREAAERIQGMQI